MKKIIFGMFVVFFTINISAQEINWITFEEAVALQKKNPKKIMMDVYTNWCGPCKMLDRNTFQNKDVVEYVNANFYAVKFNAEGNSTITYKDNTFSNPGYDASKANRRNSPHEFSRFLQIRAYPTIAFFDEELRLIAPITGYQNPQQLELYLKLFKSDEYKSMTSQEAFNEYYKNFKPSFGQTK
ncbi:thioredoxin family protein [Winogradskyella wandonensis]|nr:thioredoxin fold domain-containing protein [Winogradskyella wandonensis]